MFRYHILSLIIISKNCHINSTYYNYSQLILFYLITLHTPISIAPFTINQPSPLLFIPQNLRSICSIYIACIFHSNSLYHRIKWSSFSVSFIIPTSAIVTWSICILSFNKQVLLQKPAVNSLWNYNLTTLQNSSELSSLKLPDFFLFLLFTSNTDKITLSVLRNSEWQINILWFATINTSASTTANKYKKSRRFTAVPN